jgi:hypothetical protein
MYFKASSETERLNLDQLTRRISEYTGFKITPEDIAKAKVLLE